MHSLLRASVICGLAGVLGMTACGQLATPASPVPTSMGATAAAPTAAARPMLTGEPVAVPTALPTSAPRSAPTSMPIVLASTPQPEQATSAPDVAAPQAEIKLFTFQPSPLQIAAGTTVTWTNRDAVEHSVTSGTPSEPNGVFDSGFFNEGQSFSYTVTVQA